MSGFYGIHTLSSLEHMPAAAAAKPFQSCPTLCNPTDGNPLGSSVPGILQARILEWVAMPSSRALPDPGIELASPALAGGFFTTEPPGKPRFIHSSPIFRDQA